ncbi:HoxN/HupN/NixA family nickel/cobalt transporter [Nocardia fusca]|uniref:Nickel/cobalt efflux system n=1 Tax=Nocardia fusca TaxID=941183 RepID=A0ABV3F205_9NOCA
MNRSRRPAPALLRSPQTAAIAMMAAVVIVLHAAGWMLLWAGRSHAGAALGVGVGVTAYFLGVRHAFDADHIAAVDNTTRKLIGDGRKPVTVGFWFSLGHSTVVFGLTLLLTLGARVLPGPLQDDNSRLHQVTGIVGASVSGLFLYLIAAMNLGLLVSTWRAYRSPAAVPHSGAGTGSGVRGPMTRLFGRCTGSITEPWQIYPIGVLFGLGFDTATEIGLLVLAAGSSAAGVPWYSLLSLPLIFAAGMSLMDTIDGILMRYAYGWSSATPARALRYNLVITGLSVTVAVCIGTTELLAVAAEHVHFAVGDRLRDLDLNAVGFALVALFAAVWLVTASTGRMTRRGTRAPVLSADGIDSPAGRGRAGRQAHAGPLHGASAAETSPQGRHGRVRAAVWAAKSRSRVSGSASNASNDRTPAAER